MQHALCATAAPITLIVPGSSPSLHPLLRVSVPPSHKTYFVCPRDDCPDELHHHDRNVGCTFGPMLRLQTLGRRRARAHPSKMITSDADDLLFALSTSLCCLSGGLRWRSHPDEGATPLVSGAVASSDDGPFGTSSQSPEPSPLQGFIPTATRLAISRTSATVVMDYFTAAKTTSNRVAADLVVEEHGHYLEEITIRAAALDLSLGTAVVEQTSRLKARAPSVASFEVADLRVADLHAQ